MKNFWLIVGIIIVVVIIGYFGMQPKPVQQSPAVTSKENSVYKMMSKEKLGNVVTDPKGMTLYVYTKDSSGASTCTEKCLENWPAYTASSQTGNFPANISVIKREDGALQYAWKNKPIYYYAKDKDSGDAYGNGIGGVWSVIK